MPWSATKAFPHPLANIQSSNTDPKINNSFSYDLVETMTWQGLGELINQFRHKVLGLESVNLLRAPGMEGRLLIPYTYCWYVVHLFDGRRRSLITMCVSATICVVASSPG